MKQIPKTCFMYLSNEHNDPELKPGYDITNFKLIDPAFYNNNQNDNNNQNNLLISNIDINNLEYQEKV